MTSPLLAAPWDQMTVHSLAKGNALIRPENPLFIEDEDAAAVLHRPARSLSGKEFYAAAMTTARQLVQLGLEPGERVLLVVPNSIDAMVAICATMMCGAVPALLPVYAEREHIRRALEQAKAAGIISVGRFAGLRPAQAAADVAVNLINVRFVAVFGDDAPANVSKLDAWEFDPDEPAVRLPTVSPTSLAVITFEMGDGEMRGFARTHAQVIAEALNVTSAAHIVSDGLLIAPLPPTAITGFLLSFCAPILTGSAVRLIPLFDRCSFAADLGTGDATTLVLPAGAEAALLQHRQSRPVRNETTVFVHRPAPHDAPHPARLPEQGKTVDVCWYGEAFGISVRRHGHPARRDRHSHPDVQAADGIAFSEDRRGRLILEGRMAPAVIGEIGALHTAYRVDAVQSFVPRFTTEASRPDDEYSDLRATA